MIVSGIKFTSNFDNFYLKQPVSTDQTVEKVNILTETKKNNNLKKYTLIGAGILLAGILIFKGKSLLNKLVKKIKPQTSNVKTNSVPAKPQTGETVETIKPQVVETAQNPTKQNRYALIDEYEKLTRERAEFKKQTSGRNLTDKEKVERDRLRIAWSKVAHRLVPEHQSVIRTKSAADFSSESEKKDYIMKYVLPRMNVSEESALDALDMFEQFGFRANYPSGINTTITMLAEGTYTLPKESKTDKVLNRFIEVFGKFCNNRPSKYPDDEELCSVLTDFAEKGQDIQEETFLKGIQLMKKIISQKRCAEYLDYALISSYDAKFKQSEPIIKALDDLNLTAKNMKYAWTADDRLKYTLEDDD